MTPYHDLARRLAALQQEGRQYTLGGFPPPPRPPLPPGAPKTLLFSPHPDDECIIGGLPLRLMREAGHRVMNVAVTQGSLRGRQAERLAELRHACEYLGFELLQTAPNGLEQVNPRARQGQPADWAVKVRVIARILDEHRPAVVFLPHAQDWNSTHIGVHLLVTDAFRLVEGFVCRTVETEFWGAMADPNLMVELSPGQVGDLMAATSFHVGEVRRNPYHLLLPAWMQDNVRRGGELVGGQGGAAPDFQFATLYRLGRWNGRLLAPVEPASRLLPAGTLAGSLLNGTLV